MFRWWISTGRSSTGWLVALIVSMILFYCSRSSWGKVESSTIMGIEPSKLPWSPYYSWTKLSQIQWLRSWVIVLPFRNHQAYHSRNPQSRRIQRLRFAWGGWSRFQCWQAYWFCTAGRELSVTVSESKTTLGAVSPLSAHWVRSC